MNVSKRIFLFVCLSALFHSCVSFSPSDTTSEAILEVDLDGSMTTAMNSGEFEVGEWPEPNWWTMFGDDQLTAFVEEAICESPTMLMAEAKVREASAIARKEKSPLYPDLELNFHDNYEHLPKDSLFRYPPSIIPAVINQVDLSLHFEYELDIWGKNMNAYRASLGYAKAQAAEAAQTMLMISVQVCKEYYNIQINQKKLQMYYELLCLRQKRLELIGKRVVGGIDNQLPFFSMEREVQEIEQKILQTENELALNEHLLNVLMGRGPDADQSEMILKTIRFDEPFILPETLSMDLISRRADISAAIWRVEAEAKKIGAAKAAFYPNINLRAIAGFETLSWTKLLELSNFQGILLPALHLPIFKGGELRANLREKIAAFDAAVYNYNEVVLKAAQDVSDQISTLLSVDRQKMVHFQSVISALNESTMRMARYRQGIDNRLISIQAQEIAIQEQILQLDLERLKIFSTLKLIKALGGGYCSPKEIILKEEASYE